MTTTKKRTYNLTLTAGCALTRVLGLAEQVGSAMATNLFGGAGFTVLACEGDQRIVVLARAP